MSARELFSHQGKCLIFSFVFGNGQGEQERKPCEQQGLLSYVATRGPGSLVSQVAVAMFPRSALQRLPS